MALADNAAGQGLSHLEFKIVVEPPDGQSFSVVLLAPSRQEKAAWTSDISQVGDGWGWEVRRGDVSWSVGGIKPPSSCFSASITSDVTA